MFKYLRGDTLSMRYKVYDPQRGTSRGLEKREERDVGGLISDVERMNPKLSRIAATALSDLDDRNVRASASIRKTLRSFETGTTTATAARARIINVYRENLPSDIPVEGAIERLYSA